MARIMSHSSNHTVKDFKVGQLAKRTGTFWVVTFSGLGEPHCSSEVRLVNCGSCCSWRGGTFEEQQCDSSYSSLPPQPLEEQF